MTLLVGVGNVLRGDDGVGPAVAAAVADLRIAGVEVVAACEPLALLELFACHQAVVVVDATAPGPRPGHVRVRHLSGGSGVPPGRSDLRRETAGGSHGLGVGAALGLARALDRLPGELTLVGVEAGDVRLGEGLSAPVRDVLPGVVRVVVAEIARLAGSPVATSPGGGGT